MIATDRYVMVTETPTGWIVERDDCDSVVRYTHRLDAERFAVKLSRTRNVRLVIISQLELFAAA